MLNTANPILIVPLRGVVDEVFVIRATAVPAPAVRNETAGSPAVAVPLPTFITTIEFALMRAFVRVNVYVAPGPVESDSVVITPV